MPLGSETPPDPAWLPFLPAISGDGNHGEEGEQPAPVAPMAPMAPMEPVKNRAMDRFFFLDIPDPHGGLLAFEADGWFDPYPEDLPSGPAAAGASAAVPAAMDGGDDDFDILFGDFATSISADDPDSSDPAAGFTQALASEEPAAAIAGPATLPAPALPPAPAIPAPNPVSATAPVIGLPSGSGLLPVPGQPYAMGQLPASTPHAVATPGNPAHPAPCAGQGLRPPGFRVQNNLVLRHDWPQGPLNPPQKHRVYERSDRPKPPQDNSAWCNSCEHWLWAPCFERTPLGARDTSRCCNRCHWRKRRELGLYEWMRLAQPRMLHLIRRDPGYSA
ncbi:hypothetical protein CI238_08339 [Colletotrichum incanum]|uniref:Uncharacterized protein n=1 Tax=Colletotrichum incanum TaxID=1573173 RepID=A0A161W0U6_COLIC|nr:hypothetical protein CI238_08339 [Colletotrichum incanum]